MNDIVTQHYPCNRGIPNTLGVGFHNYVAQPGGVPTCTYCGAQRSNEPLRWKLPPSVTSDVTSQPGCWSVETSR